MKILIISVLNDFFLHCFLMNDRNKLVDINYFVSCDHISCPKIIFSCEILKFSTNINFNNWPLNWPLSWSLLPFCNPAALILDFWFLNTLICFVIDKYFMWKIFRSKINHICLDSFCHFLTHHYEFSLEGVAGNKQVPPAPPGLAKLYSIIVNWPWRLLHEVSKCPSSARLI